MAPRFSFHKTLAIRNRTKVQWATRTESIKEKSVDLTKPMPFEKFDLENLDDERRKAIAKSIRTISVEELKKLGEEIFRYADDPWRETFFRFIAENPGATFHHAITSDGVNIVYCRDQDKGMWFLPGSGMGPLQATGRQIMKEMIAGGH
jgi:hypothetical protein